jgi:hypothetical protein
VDIVKSFPLDIQHIEFEGEVQRSLILFFNLNKDLIKSDKFSQMINLINKINTITSTNIKNFIEKNEKLKDRVFKTTKEIFNAEKELDILDNINNPPNEIQNDEVMTESTNQDNQKKKKKKFKDQITINSGECMILFNLLFFFFYDFIRFNINKFEIKNLIAHKKICELLFKFEFTGNF